MTNSTHIYPFERDDYPFPQQCVAILDASSDARSKRCGKAATRRITDHFPVCATHERFLDDALVHDAAGAMVAQQAIQIEAMQQKLRRADGEAAEWRRLASKKHGSAAMEEYRPVEAKDSFVYFIRGGDYIKIGKADNPDARFIQLGRGGVIAPKGVDFSTIEMLAVEPGGFVRELWLHQTFADLRVSGEWFTAHQRLLDYIGSLEDSLPPIGGKEGRKPPNCAG